MITLQCHSCQQPFQVSQKGQFLCPHCGIVNVVDPLTFDKSFSIWETCWKSRPFYSFYEVGREVLIHPVQFFQKLKVSPKIFPVITFGIISQMIGFISAMIYQIAFSILKPALLSLIFQQAKMEQLVEGAVLPVFFIVLLLLMPFLSFVGLILSTAVNHFFLWILRGTQNGFKATLHAVCYSQIAQVVMIIPLFGSLIAAVWQIVLLVIGLKETQDIPYWKSVLVIFIPLLLCCGGILVLGGLLIAIFFPMLMQNGVMGN